MSGQEPVVQLWLGNIRAGKLDPVRCPRCGCEMFTAARRLYGVEMACWRCPTYIGIRRAEPLPEPGRTISPTAATLITAGWALALALSAVAVLWWWAGVRDLMPVVVVSGFIGMASWVRDLPVRKK